MSPNKLVAIPEIENAASQLVKSQNSGGGGFSHIEEAKLHYAVD